MQGGRVSGGEFCLAMRRGGQCRLTVSIGRAHFPVRQVCDRAASCPPPDRWAPSRTGSCRRSAVDAAVSHRVCSAEPPPAPLQSLSHAAMDFYANFILALLIALMCFVPGVDAKMTAGDVM